MNTHPTPIVAEETLPTSHEPVLMRRRKNIWTCPTCATTVTADFMRFPQIEILPSEILCYGDRRKSNDDDFTVGTAIVRRRSEPAVDITLALEVGDALPADAKSEDLATIVAYGMCALVENCVPILKNYGADLTG
jgi:hypothetical protein